MHHKSIKLLILLPLRADLLCTLHYETPCMYVCTFLQNPSISTIYTNHWENKSNLKQINIEILSDIRYAAIWGISLGIPHRFLMLAIHETLKGNTVTFDDGQSTPI